MKPIYVKMKCFGSYRDEIIDFARVNHGIFLITGDTGAGKTTIFDAITYALYDESSGGKRSDQMMVSQYARPTERTEVEYCFRIGEDVYTILRSPEQKKYKEKKLESGEIIYEELKTTEKPSVQLTLPDGTFYSGKKKETDEKIKEIIGIDCQQFTQICMLAQGDFLKLLHAESKKRREIFSRIFDTRFYYDMEQEIDSRFKKVYGELEDNKKEISNRLLDIVCPTESELSEKWLLKGQFSDDRKDEIIDLIKEINQYFSTLYEQTNGEIAKLDKKDKSLQKSLDEAGAVNKDFDCLDAAVRELNMLKSKEHESEAVKLRISNAENALKIDGSYTLLAEKNRAVNEKKERLNTLSKELEVTKSKNVLLKKAQEDAERAYTLNYDSKTKEQAALESMIGLYDEYENIKKAYDDSKKKLDKVNEKLEEAKSVNVEIEKQKIIVKEAESALVIAKDTYNKKYSDFINNQAHILRQGLIEGEPCPVCGSVHHIVIKDTAEINITSEEVDNAARKLETARNYLETARNTYSEQKEKELRINSEAKALTAGLMAVIKEKEEQLNALKIKLPYPDRNQAVKHIEDLRKYTNELKLGLESATKAYQKNAEAENRIVSTIETEQKNLLTLNEEFENAGNIFHKACNDNGFSSVEEYRQARLADIDLQKYRQALESYKEKVQKNQYDLNNYSERTKGKARIDVSVFIEQKKEITTKLKSLQDNKQEIYAVCSGNEKAMTVIEQKYLERKDMLLRYSVLKSLNDTAGGKLSKKRMNFQTYIQRRYFKRVIDAANVRLIKMSNNQFILRCRDIDNLGTQGEVGLDLDVYSVVNDQTRDVKSLSGGESFQAALSMALGLSDIIQNTVGKIRIETMFIDEGFGSLSDEVRNQALELLNELSEGSQLIGIISHVSELKAQVETKLIVTKSENGSKAVWSN